MNHAKLVNDILNSYSDFPKTQADMKKLLGYAESQFRMFLTPIIKDTAPAPAPRSIGKILAVYPTQLRRELKIVIDSLVELATTASVNGIRYRDTDDGMTGPELIQLLTDKHFEAFRKVHGDKLPSTLRDDLEFITAEIVGTAKYAAVAAVDDFIARKKQEAPSAPL